MEIIHAMRPIVLTDGDPSVQFIVFICYAAIGYYSYRRFNRLEVDFQRYSLMTVARSWTTFIRFYLFATFYFLCIAVSYRVLLRFPEFIDTIKDVSGLKEHIASLESAFEGTPFLYPITAMLLLTVMLSRIGPLAEIDRQARKYLQKLGSIPRQSFRLISMMERATMRLTGDARGNFRFDPPFPVDVDMLGWDVHTIESLWLRAQFLVFQVRRMNRSHSDYYTFYYTNKEEIEGIEDALDAITEKVNTCYELQEVLGKVGSQSLSGSSEEERIQRTRNRLKADFEKNTRKEMEDFLWRIYHLFAAAVLWKTKTAGQSISELEKLGFDFSGIDIEMKPDEAAVNLMEDISFLAITLLLALPAAFIVAFLLGAEIEIPKKTVISALIPMAVFYPTITALSVLAVKLKTARARSGIWAALGRSRRGKPIQSYILSGLLAGVLCATGLVILGWFDSGGFLNEPARLKRLSHWGFFMAGITGLTVGSLLDNTWFHRSHQILEALYLGTITALSGIMVFACHLEEGNFFLTKQHQSALIFISAACFFLGAIMGYIIPQAYRNHFNLNVQSLKRFSGQASRNGNGHPQEPEIRHEGS